MVASACLPLAAVHLLVWRQQRGSRHHGLFALSAVGTAALAANELWLLRAETVEELEQAIRWGHLPFWVVMISLVGFVRIYMRAGRRWLAWTVCGLRTLSLVLNFLFTPNIHFREITGFRSTFEQSAAGEKFNPHVSTGNAPKEYLDKMVAEPFMPFAFSPAGAAVYQLGPFGTAAKKPKEWDLKR